MPLYEYSCRGCGRTFEVIQKFSDTPLTVDPQCGGPVERLISAAALQFKGSGWYVTDYAKGGKSTAPGANGSEAKSDAPKPSAKSESSTESKPAKT
jgi:putative FmdB family regulatory protein